MTHIFQHENYDHEWFMGRLKLKNGMALQPQTSAEEYKVHIEDVYNYRNPNKVNLRY